MVQEELHTDNISPAPSLPEHLILYEIFARLPVKSIYRFRCVSTSCRRLLTSDDKQFLSAFRRLSSRHYLLSISHHYQERSLYSLNQSGVTREIQNPTDRYWTHASIINGLLFTVDVKRTVNTVGQGVYKYTVSNANTEETFELPQLPIPGNRQFFYLCHDPKTDTYKVIRAVWGHLPMWQYNIITLGPAVTSWRSYSLPGFRQLGYSKSVCINGTLYLTRFRHLENDTAVICAFIVGSEGRFCGISYPDGLSPSKYDEYCHLIEMEGALAVVEIVKEYNKCEIKLWRLLGDDYESWSTELRIGFDPRWETTFRLSMSHCFSTNCIDGEIVMGVTGWRSEDHGCWIFTYNVDKGEWTRRVKVRVRGLSNQRVAGISLVVDQSWFRWERFTIR